MARFWPTGYANRVLLRVLHRRPVSIAPSNFALARYTASGTLDTGFGSGGTVITLDGAAPGVYFGHFDDLESRPTATWWP